MIIIIIKKYIISLVFAFKLSIYFSYTFFSPHQTDTNCSRITEASDLQRLSWLCAAESPQTDTRTPRLSANLPGPTCPQLSTVINNRSFRSRQSRTFGVLCADSSSSRHSVSSVSFSRALPLALASLNKSSKKSSLSHYLILRVFTIVCQIDIFLIILQQENCSGIKLVIKFY